MKQWADGSVTIASLWAVMWNMVLAAINANPRMNTMTLGSEFIGSPNTKIMGIINVTIRTAVKISSDLLYLVIIPKGSRDGPE